VESSAGVSTAVSTGTDTSVGASGGGGVSSARALIGNARTSNNETRTVSITQATKRELRKSVEEVYDKYRNNEGQNILFMRDEFGSIMYSDVVNVVINFTD
jgi:3-polyprenyl-4-hydroxybenzoate decarboxylase